MSNEEIEREIERRLEERRKASAELRAPIEKALATNPEELAAVKRDWAEQDRAYEAEQAEFYRKDLEKNSPEKFAAYQAKLEANRAKYAGLKKTPPLKRKLIWLRYPEWKWFFHEAARRGKWAESDVEMVEAIYKNDYAFLNELGGKLHRMGARADAMHKAYDEQHKALVEGTKKLGEAMEKIEAARLRLHEEAAREEEPNPSSEEYPEEAPAKFCSETPDGPDRTESEEEDK